MLPVLKSTGLMSGCLYLEWTSASSNAEAMVSTSYLSLVLETHSYATAQAGFK